MLAKRFIVVGRAKGALGLCSDPKCNILLRKMKERWQLVNSTEKFMFCSYEHADQFARKQGLQLIKETFIQHGNFNLHIVVAGIYERSTG